MILFTNSIAFSQVGIGTTSPNPSSMLDISSTRSGLLIPRVSLTSTSDTTTIQNPAISLLVYNTNTQNDITPGFYYWQGGWKAFKENSTGGTTGGWSLSGNTLSSGNEYLGTNNYNSLLFKVNNNQVGKFHPNGGIALGNGAVANNERSISIGSNSNASASNESIAIGTNTTASGFQSTAIGLQTRASNNSSIAIGNNSNASGQNASTFGAESEASGQNATALGFQAKASQANSIILGSPNNSNNKIGIGTNAPDERLHVVGSVKIVDGNQGAGKVLTSDATGKGTWTDINATKFYGEIYRNSNTALTSGAITMGTNGVGNGVTLNGNGIQVQTTGLYRVSYTISLKKNSGSSINPEFFLTIYGTEIPGTRTYATVANTDSRSVSLVKLVNLTAFQAVFVHSSISDTNTSLLANGCNLVVELIK